MKKISIPTPCHEDWNQMTPAEQGRFCQSCEKVVVDFQGVSKDKVLEHLAQHDGNTCGRINSDQLDVKTRVFNVPERLLHQTKKAGWWLSAFSLLSFNLKSKTTQAQGTWAGTPIPPEEESTYLNAAPLLLQGSVLDSTTQSMLSGVDVVVESGGQAIGQAFTDSTGTWRIELSADQIFSHSFNVQYYRNGYDVGRIESYPAHKDEITLRMPLVPEGLPMAGTFEVVFEQEPFVWEITDFPTGGIMISGTVSMVEPFGSWTGQLFTLPDLVVFDGEAESEAEKPLVVPPGSLPHGSTRLEVETPPLDSPSLIHASQQRGSTPEPEQDLPRTESKAIIPAQTDFEFNLFPNPARNFFQLDLKKPGNYHVMIFDLNGKCVHLANTTESAIELDISDLSAGAYLVQVSNFDDHSMHTERLVVQS